MEEAKKLIAGIIERNKTTIYYDFFKSQFDIYLANKPREHDLLLELEGLHQTIYQNSIPVVHQFKIEKVPAS
jgi:hypothetical protein